MFSNCRTADALTAVSGKNGSLQVGQTDQKMEHLRMKDEFGKEGFVKSAGNRPGATKVGWKRVVRKAMLAGCDRVNRLRIRRALCEWVNRAQSGSLSPFCSYWCAWWDGLS